MHSSRRKMDVMSSFSPLFMIETLLNFAQEAACSNTPRCKEENKSCQSLAKALRWNSSNASVNLIVLRSKSDYTRECAGEKSPCISSECVGLRETYFNCKRGQVDMRARIRGNKGY
ncbi:hypothetical protein MRB53_009590 [Persea americana]|uniref:Uncharacterized protein n=1 Tax=Persea americana TaxID=3435 RepID=A0ACC2LQ82_PERAE|nr:hypothetical protein MRB53_009590 [Persea americana]